MSTRSAHESLKVIELPVPYRERLGRSKLSVFKDGIRFLQTILWTALNYNPVRILGGLGVLLAVIATLIISIIVSLRLMGVTTLGPWGAAGAFSAVLLGSTGITLFALGVTFNYLVSLFHKRPIRQGLFGQPIFKEPLDRHFWWIGLLMIACGIGLGGFQLCSWTARVVGRTVLVVYAGQHHVDSCRCAVSRVLVDRKGAG